MKINPKTLERVDPKDPSVATARKAKEAKKKGNK